jgi:hypothetical protein
MPELDRVDNLIEHSTISGTTSLPEEDNESDPEMPMITATRTETKAKKTGNAIIAMPQVTCKLTARKEKLPEYFKLMEPVNLLGDRTRQLEKLS